MFVYRKLRPIERKAYEDHLLTLTPDDRRLRFFGSMSDDAVRAHVSRIDFTRTVVIGCFVDAKLHGAAELVFHRLFLPKEAELAVTVESPFQHHGIGLELTRRAVTIARNRGIEQLHMNCLPENLRMRRIAKKLGAVLDFDEGTIDGKVGLAKVTPLSLWVEAVEESAGTLMSWPGRAAA